MSFAKIKTANYSINIKIEACTPDRANEIANLYHASVHAIDENIYTKSEQEAWAS